MEPRRARRWLVLACGLALVALGLMIWQIFDPRVFPVIVAMSVGQMVGTASFVVYLYVVVADLRAQLRRGRATGETGPSRASSV